ncbi:hypothetical protein (nucleomorph) [Guillardia theta]|uniref:Uncharacterized protein n=1 Tax=Guillardia theta TaxID=55529 RepID=Q98S14_GUITH|nr:hypothetical protein GTHECHR3120 [Guillardia theta]AAK39764.1 hypothetical protein [Guillardia theta]
MKNINLMRCYDLKIHLNLIVLNRKLGFPKNKEDLIYKTNYNESNLKLKKLKFVFLNNLEIEYPLWVFNKNITNNYFVNIFNFLSVSPYYTIIYDIFYLNIFFSEFLSVKIIKYFIIWKDFLIYKEISSPILYSNNIFMYPFNNYMLYNNFNFITNFNGKRIDVNKSYGALFFIVKYKEFSKKNVGDYLREFNYVRFNIRTM